MYHVLVICLIHYSISYVCTYIMSSLFEGFKGSNIEPSSHSAVAPPTSYFIGFGPQRTVYVCTRRGEGKKKRGLRTAQ